MTELNKNDLEYLYGFVMGVRVSVHSERLDEIYEKLKTIVVDKQ